MTSDRTLIGLLAAAFVIAVALAMYLLLPPTEPTEPTVGQPPTRSTLPTRLTREEATPSAEPAIAAEPEAPRPRYEVQLQQTETVRIPLLVDVLEDAERSRDDRRGAMLDLVRIEGEMPGAGALEALLAFAIKPDLDIEGVAITGTMAARLTELGTPQALDCLRRLAASAAEPARLSAALNFAQALKDGRLEDPSVLQVIDEMAANDPSAQVRELLARYRR